ncbi:MAG: multidrug transporter MdfA, partial [Caedimonadaceae bacterium]
MTQYRLFPFFLILYEFSTYLSNDMYLPAFPILGGDFSVHDDRVQLTMTAWLFGNALL